MLFLIMIIKKEEESIVQINMAEENVSIKRGTW